MNLGSSRVCEYFSFRANVDSYVCIGFFVARKALTYCYRQRQRRQLEAEMYMPGPHVQFHTFNDSGYVRYDESEPFS